MTLQRSFRSGSRSAEHAAVLAGVVLAFVAFAVPVRAGGGADGGPSAIEGARPEAEVKAAFLFNFARFVEWPPPDPSSDPSSLDVCLIGVDRLGDVLERTVAGKAIGNTTLVVRRIGSIEAVAGCALLFVSASMESKVGAVLESVRGMPILTVGDSDGFAEAGGMIGMYIEDNRVRFAINPEEAANAKLRISSRLLSLATIVRTKPRGRS